MESNEETCFLVDTSFANTAPKAKTLKRAVNSVPLLWGYGVIWFILPGLGPGDPGSNPGSPI